MTVDQVCERCSRNLCHFCGTAMGIGPQRRAAGIERIAFWLATCSGVCDRQFGEFSEGEELALVPSHPDPEAAAFDDYRLSGLLRAIQRHITGASSGKWDDEARQAGLDLAAALADKLREEEPPTEGTDAGHYASPAVEVEPQ